MVEILCATLTGAPAVIALRQAYRSQLLIIAAHDLAQAVESSLPAVALPAVTQALSDLADATLQVGLTLAATGLPETAAPARLAIIAMGKCGARELNYISDVDVIFAAEMATPELLAFTVKYTSGVVCVPLAGVDCDRLELPPMYHVNQDRKGTAYTVSVDAREGVSTGISAADLDQPPFIENGGTDGALRDLGPRAADLIDQLNVELTA